MNAYTTKQYQRITKAAARKAYAAGDTVYFCPVKLNPESPLGLMWYPPNNDIPFDKIVLEFEWYNCTSETGKYTAFYKEVRA